ncbi:MAG: AAA family ATPase [Croceibacterium sp.]
MEETHWVTEWPPDEAGMTVESDLLSKIPLHVVNSGLGSSFSAAGVRNEVLQEQPGDRSNRKRLRSISDVLADPPARYIVEDVLPERGLVAIYGAPAAGKSFLALDLCGAIAASRPLWFGLHVAPAPVAYVALEGAGGVRRRLQAWLQHTGSSPTSPLHLLTERLSLLDPPQAEAFGELIREELGAGAVTVIDTLARAMAGGDENNSTDMTTSIACAERVGAIVEGPVVLIHHTGKEASRGLRGHSSLVGAVDVSIEVTSGAHGRSWVIRKNKEGEEGVAHDFSLVSYAVGMNQWGKETRSCAVQPLHHTSRPIPPVTGKNRIAVMNAVRPLLAGSPAGVALDQATSAAAGALSVGSGRRNTVAKATLRSLADSGHVLITGTVVSLPCSI